MNRQAATGKRPPPKDKPVIGPPLTGANADRMVAVLAEIEIASSAAMTATRSLYRSVSDLRAWLDDLEVACLRLRRVSKEVMG